MAIEFDLADYSQSQNQEECESPGIPPIAAVELVELAENPRFWSGLTETDDEQDDDANMRTFYFFPSDGIPYAGTTNTLGEIRADDSETFIGMTQREALLASRDPYGTTTCSTRHIHDNIANRWCHGYMANNFSRFLRRQGVSRPLAALAGGIFWVPKEYFKDLNPSANDVVITFEGPIDVDNGIFRNRLSGSVTVYGDVGGLTLPGQKSANPTSTSPFVTLRLCLGSEEACARRRR